VKSRLTPEAELDLIEAIRWYDERDQELGDDFLRCVYQCVGSLERNPRLYPIVHRQMIRALVRRFPYQILYEIEIAQSTTLLAIRKPGRDEKTANTRISFLARDQR
jgi:hypothetical protein